MGATPAITPLDLEAERAFLGPALDEAIAAVLASGRYVLGPVVDAFERDFAAAHNVPHCVGVGSGTDALILGLKALGVGPGDRVLTTPFSFFASAGTIAWIGATPVLADVDPETGLLDPERAAAALSTDIACILPVHLYGQLADVQAFRALADASGAKLLEDAAQAHGATRAGVHAGETGDATSFSFYPTKNLGCAGEGGAVLTRDTSVAEALKRLRDHGSIAKYEHVEIGTNSRLHTLQAAILSVKLPHLAAWNERRRQLAARYDAALAGSDTIRALRSDPGSACHQYAVRVPAEIREAVHRGLADAGIHAAVHYPRPVHLQAAAAGWGYGPGSLPAAEALAREVLCLPIHPFLGDSDVDRVAETLLGLAP